MDFQQKLLLGESRLFVPTTNLHLPYFFGPFDQTGVWQKDKHIGQIRKLVFCLIES